MDKNYVGTIGFRYITDIERASAEDVARIARYAAANVSDGLNKFYTMDCGIRQMTPGNKMCGTAVTVKVRSGDNLMLHKAIGLCRPGDVLVVETQRGFGYAVSGELMHTSMKGLGIAGLVVDGCVRDIEESRQLDFPIFARGTVCGAGDKAGPGEINFPVACGGVVVRPGDIVLGDADGVVVVPKEDIEAVIAGVDKKLAAEAKRHEGFKQGIFLKNDVDALLEKNGFQAD